MYSFTVWSNFRELMKPIEESIMEIIFVLRSTCSTIAESFEMLAYFWRAFNSYS